MNVMEINVLIDEGLEGCIDMAWLHYASVVGRCTMLSCYLVSHFRDIDNVVYEDYTQSPTCEIA